MRMYGPAWAGAEKMAAELVGGADLRRVLEIIGDRLEDGAPELVVTARMMDKASALAVELVERIAELEGELEEAREQHSRRDLIDVLHSERSHRGYWLTCDQCCDDADLFLRIAVPA